MNFFVNFTNHPSSKWEKKQRDCAVKYGEIVDIPFPPVDPMADRNEIALMAETYVDKIMEYAPAAVLCQGEVCLAYRIITALKSKNVVVLAACSNRNTIDKGNQKLVTFTFEQFREY